MAQPPQTNPMPADPSSLDNLQAMMNLVLVSGGNYLKHHHLGQVPSQAQQVFKRTVTGASERFHDSLDELEAEVQRAQLVLRRDLALIKADKRKREAAAKEKEAEKARLAAESTAQKPAPPVKKEEPPKPASPPPVKTEAPVKSNTPPDPPPEPSATAPKTETESPIPAPAASAAPSDAQNAPVEDTNTDLPQDNEFDFDALFGDTMDNTGGEGDNQGDLNLDGSGPDLNFSLDDTGPSLLPGLEDYAKSGGDDPPQDTNTNINVDLPMPDLDMSGTAPSQPSTTKPGEEPPAQQSATDELNLDAMTTDNLDDLFDMDYTNPEDSQFDDAFFGFGE